MATRDGRADQLPLFTGPPKSGPRAPKMPRVRPGQPSNTSIDVLRTAPSEGASRGSPPLPPKPRPSGVRVGFRPDVPRGARDPARALALGEVLLAEASGVDKVELTINANQRRVLSWRIRGGALLLSVHHLVLHAPEHVAAVVLRRDAEAWTALRVDFEAHERPEPSPNIDLSPAGAVHDLHEIFHEVNSQLFDGAFTLGPALTVGWGSWPRVPPRRSLRLGSCAGKPPVLRIHPCLDHPLTPRWFVDFVLYHELLHVKVPPQQGPSGRRRVHPPEFRALERLHPRYLEALSWETKNIRALIRRTAAQVTRPA